LVLFPRHAGKPKKGLVNDATDADVKQFGSIQVTDVNHSLPVHQVGKREKPVKITKEMKEAKVYKKLRLERTNAYYAGKREKKAKEAAAKWENSLLLLVKWNNFHVICLRHYNLF